MVHVFEHCGIAVKYDRAGIVGLIESKEFCESSLPGYYVTTKEKN